MTLRTRDLDADLSRRALLKAASAATAMAATATAAAAFPLDSVGESHRSIGR